MRPRRGPLTVLSAALLTALLTMPAGAVVNPVNPAIPKVARSEAEPDSRASVVNPVNPAIPKVKKVCLANGQEQYQFEVVRGGVRMYLSASPSITTGDAFTYEGDVWKRVDDEYFAVDDLDMSHPARIANASTVCRRPNSATTAAAASAAAWEQVIKATSYSAQAAAWNRWQRDHCVESVTVDCGQTYPTMAQTCAQNPPGTKLSTGETCPG